MMNADTLILLGTQFPYRRSTDRYHHHPIDINPASIGAHSKVDMALIGDMQSTLPALLPMLEEKATATSSIKRWATTVVRAKGWMI
ncbi:hypothetical protein ACNKHO_05355 [Shigella flexneri]